jgi:putative NADH-flavin reductase
MRSSRKYVKLLKLAANFTRRTDGYEMKILIIGATGGTGKAIVEQALSQGHAVTVLARNPTKITIKHEQLVVVKGNVLDYDSVDHAVHGHDVVVSALGHKHFF